MSRPGGVGEAHPADDTARNVANNVRGAIEAQTGPLSTFEVVSYATQVVAGRNYFLKIHVGGDKYLHARVYQGLPPGQEISLHSIQQNKTAQDPIEHF